MACRPSVEQSTSIPSDSMPAAISKIPIIIDTDANNELDDQHAMAYLFFNGDHFQVRGVTVNATSNGGNIDKQYAEAERVMKMCGVYEHIPLLKGADGTFHEITSQLMGDRYDGADAVAFIIGEARLPREQKLVLLPVGKLTNIALALMKAPDIKDKVRIVWLGSNYPEPGEYNQNNDELAMNYVLEQNVPFEMVTVRYGQPSGSDVVRATPDLIKEKMTGKGPQLLPVVGRHGNEFWRFGDYSVSLFNHADLHGDPPSRALFDMVAVAIIKNPDWGEQKMIAAPTLIESKWQERPDNQRQITLWENFDTMAILDDFFGTMEKPVIAQRN